MRSNSVLAAALAALASVAAAEPGRPKIYFPRHVKRQYTNATSTAEDATVSAAGVPLFQSTKKEPSLGDLFSSLAGQGAAKPSSTSKTGLLNAAIDSKVTTVVVASTIVVPPKPSRTEVPSSAAASATDSATGSGSDSESDSPTDSGSDSGSSLSSFPTSASSNTGTNDTATGPASTGSLPPPLIILPSAKSSKTSPSSPTGASNSTALSQSSGSTSASPVPTSSSSSSSGILLAPTGVVSATSSDGPLGPIGGLLSSVVSEVTEALGPTANATGTPTETKPTTVPVSTDPTVSLPLTILPPGTGSSTVPSGTGAPETYAPPPVTNATDTTTAPDTVTIPTSGPTAIPDVNSTITDVPTDTPPAVTSAPTTIVTISQNTTSVNSTIPVSSPTPVSTADEYPGETSISPTGTVTVTQPASQPWLPTTIVVDPTPTTTTLGLAPTSAVTLPTALPKAITPDSASEPQPDDTTLIQIGFDFGMNYPFVVSNSKAAAQIFQLLPTALSYAGGFPVEKVQMRKLIPLNTQQSLGYVTTLAIVTYPSNMVETLRMDVKIPSSALYANPEQLVYNLTQQINPAIDIILGSYPEDGVDASGNGKSSTVPTSEPNSDPFDNDSDEDDSTSSQKGATAGIAFGVVGVAAAYGAAMFLIARRYKRKKQAHRRASSISDSSEMRTAGSPPLMGGALLSRDFSSYGGVAGGRDSQGSGRSQGNSARTAVISAPMAAENSLGWN